MNRTFFESGDQKYWRTGRSRSLVSGLALSGEPTGATQRLSTPSRGAVQLSQRPSGDIWPLALTGLPNNLVRSINGTPLRSAATIGWAARTEEAARASFTRVRIIHPPSVVYYSCVT